MAFAVTASVPDMYQWNNILESFSHGMRKYGVHDVDEVMVNHYAWLLQLASWTYDIDWDPKAGVVSLELPLGGKLMGIDLRKDQLDHDNTIARDNISIIFDQCIQSVHFTRFLSHFIKQGD